MFKIHHQLGAFAGKMGTVSPLGPDGQVITNANQIILGGKVTYNLNIYVWSHTY